MENRHQIRITVITYAYSALEKGIYNRLMRSRSRLHVTCTLEERRIEGTLFDFAGGSRSIRGGAVEEEKLKRLTQA